MFNLLQIKLLQIFKFLFRKFFFLSFFPFSFILDYKFNCFYTFPLSLSSIFNRCPTQPTVTDCAEGDYTFRKGALIWNLPVLTPESGSVAIDFDLAQSLQNEEYFPIICKFSVEKNLAGLIVSFRYLLFLSFSAYFFSLSLMLLFFFFILHLFFYIFSFPFSLFFLPIFGLFFLLVLR